MTSAAETHLAEAYGRSWASLLAPLGGLGIVAGLILLMISPAGDDTGERPAEVVAFAESHGGWKGFFAIFALLSVLLLTACPNNQTPAPCTASSCAGCCSSSGKCETGIDNTAGDEFVHFDESLHDLRGRMGKWLNELQQRIGATM